MSGCDTVSAWLAQGKIKALKSFGTANDLIFKHSQIWDLRGMYQQTSSIAFGEASSWSAVRQDTKIVGAIHASVKKKKTHCSVQIRARSNLEHCRPCEDALLQHTLGPTIRRLSGDAALKTCQTSQHHHAGHGWELDDGGSLKIRWMCGLPAPDFLNLISCTAEWTCRPSDCSCN
ncbi:hypothetical protein GWK47_009644 [Chionoecetes opilio]|uniref:Uncharacterized protein n=1 Tax=Chionoecetes opilio TaxID=41210 RepID=A0A8J5CN38_CHIOP|nr:hypothetical protein GWK47_009644 [Chionoecetes opilio]